MTSKERENFLRNAILVVDHSKAALVSLVELDVQNKGQTFDQLVTKNQHEIYHLYNSSWCCQCPPGHRPPRSPRILHQSQMELLFDRSSLKLPCHNTGRRSDDFCCSMARSGLCTDVLDLTLARCLLVNFCNDVFWFSCLQLQSITLEDFLNHNKHDIYHLWKYNSPCCQCSPGYTFPSNYSMLDQNDWMKMFNALLLSCTNHRKRPSPGGMHSICSVAAAPGITLMNLDPSVRKIILQHCSTLRMDVETLVQIRNQDYGHAKEGIMSDNDYNTSVVKIERCILDIAKVCNKETKFKQKLREAKHGALDQTLFTQYQNNLMETLTRQTDISQSVADLPKLMNEYFKKGYEYNEQLMKRFNQTLIKVKNQTHMEIDCHVTEGTFVETNAIRKFIEWMNMKDVFVIIGSEGSGKSRIGLEILRLFGQTDEDFDLLKVTDFQQVKEIITDERKTVVLLDDVLPAKECSCKCLISHHILDILNARKCKGNVKIIFTIDSSKLNSFNDILASHRLFQNCCKIDLNSSRFCMSEREKETLLLNFCKQQNICITWDSFDTSKDFYLDRRAVNEIAKTDPYIGYPKSCFLFTSNKKILQLGINFFKHTNQSLIAEINSLRCSPNINREQDISYALLIYILLDSGCLDINKLDLTKLETIMDACGYYQQRRFSINKVVKSADRMNGRFLTQDSQTMVYHFKHPMIYEALAISYFENNPTAVISVLNINFIIGLIGLERDDFGKHQTILVVEKEMFVHLAKRILAIFEKDYKTKSAGFMKLLCDSSIILQNNPDFIGLLIREFNNCTSQDTIDIHIEGGHEQMSFNFPRALLWFLIQKYNVDKPVATVIHLIENDIKDDTNLEEVLASKKVILACFYFLCETGNSDIKLELIYRMINEYRIECTYEYSLQIALKNGNDSAVNFLLSNEIDIIVKLVLEVEHVEDIKSLCDLISTNLSIECIDTYNKTDILKILVRSFPQNLNLRKSINTACSKRCKDFVIEILSDARNFTFDTGNVVNTACENGWEDALKILLNKKICNLSEKRQIFTASCKDGMEMFLKWMFLTVDTDELDVPQFVLHEYRCENFETVQHFMLKLHDLKEMETMIKNLVYQFSLPIIPFIQWILEDTEKQIVTGSKTELKSLYIVQWIYKRFPDLQNDVRNTVYKTINDTSNHCDEILHWLNENTKGIVYPITSLLDFSCKSDLQKIVKWILQTFDQNTFNIRDLIIESYKVENTKMAEVIIREIDLIKIDVTSVITAILSSCQSNSSKDPFLFLIQNIDQKYCRWMEIITIITDLELYSYIELIIQYVDNSKIDMMNIVKTNMNVLSEKKLKDLIQSIKKELLDINYIVRAALKNGYHEIVAWSIKNDNQNAINKSDILYVAVYDNNTNVMHYLLENIDHILLDIEGAVDIACRQAKFEIVEMLLVHVNDKAFDVKEAIDKVFSGITCDTVRSLSDMDNLLEIKTDKASECERIKIVKLMFEMFDHKLFDMTTIMHTAYEQRWFDLMKWVIKEVDNSLLDLNDILSMVCQLERLDIVTLLAGSITNSNVDKGAVIKTVFAHGTFNSIKLLIANNDIPLIDLGAAMNEACRDGKSELVKRLIESDNDEIDLNRLILIACDRNWQDIVKCLVENIDNKLFDMKEAMNNACWRGNLDSVKWLIYDFDYTLFDMKEAMNNACESKKLDTVKWLIDNIDNTFFDMKEAMNNACRLGNLDTVKWLIQNFDNKLFDVKEAMNNACVSENLDTVKWLRENFDNTLFDMKEAMNNACRWGNLKIVKWLIENCDNKSFDIRETMTTVCIRENPDTVKWFIENIDNKLLDIRVVLNSAYWVKNVDTAKWLIEKFDNNLFDMKEAMNEACLYGYIDIVKWLIVSFDNTLFDMQKALNNACVSENLDTVKWLRENIDNKLFDMKDVLNSACWVENVDTVKWLIEKFDNNLFDMQEAMNNACQSENLDIVKWLIDSFDNEIFDMKEAMNKACIGGKLKIVKWLLENCDKVHPTCFDLQSVLHSIYNCFDDDDDEELMCEKVNLQEIILMICKQGRHKEIVWTEVLNKAFRFGFDEVVEWLLTNLPNDVF